MGDEELKTICIYIAGRTSFVKRHNKIKEFLHNNLNCEVYLLHELVSVDTPKHELPYEAFKKCVEHMNKADIILADINIYGKDTSWEIGYCHGIGKKIIALSKNGRYLSDFMVKGALTFVAINEDQVIDIIKNQIQG